MQSAPLEFGQQLSKEQSSFEYHYYELPAVSTSMLSHSVEVRFTISFASSNYGAWATSKPELLLLKVCHSSLACHDSFRTRQLLVRPRFCCGVMRGCCLGLS